MAKTPRPRKPKPTRLRPDSAKASTFAKATADKSSGEAGTKTAAPRVPKLPKAIQTVIEAARDKKANGVVVLDLKKAGAFTDYFVICSGANPRQVQAIADSIEEALKGQKQRPSLVEGYARAEWVLLDYFDFVVHVFSKHARDFYALDRLWGSAVRHELPDQD
jgi:ribosome-associated protein